MNRIVREHYPVSKLPEDLREGFDDASQVRVTIEVLAPAEQAAGDRPVPRPGLFSAYRDLAKPRFASLEEVDDHVRTLREEWDHRDR